MIPPVPAAELDRVERQLADALTRARMFGWLPGPEVVHPSPVYRELERLSFAPDYPQARRAWVNDDPKYKEAV